ncbi:hypothetical protein Hanom_Chr16g01454491 [Helianthus anomalus]
MLQVHMSSSESSGLSDEYDPMALVFDDEVAPVAEVFMSDSESDPEMMSDDEDLDDFQPFTLPDFGDEIPLEDHVLTLPLPIHDQLIIGHPDGLAIHHVASPVVSVIDISFDSDPDSDADSWESVTSSALQAVGLEAYPADDVDAMSAAPTTPILASNTTDTPPRTPTHATSDKSSQPPIPVGPSS